MPLWSIILLAVLVILIVVFIILMITGRKRQKKQDEQREEMLRTAQTIDLFIIDMKKLRMKDAGLPKIVSDNSPRMAKIAKMPILKVRAGNRVMSMVCEADVYNTVLPNQTVKAKVSGIYVLQAKYLRGPKIEGGKEAKKEKKIDKLLDRLR